MGNLVFPVQEFTISIGAILCIQILLFFCQHMKRFLSKYLNVHYYFSLFVCSSAVTRANKRKFR